LPDPASAGAAAGAPSTIGDDAQNASRNLMQGTAADWKLIRDHADVRNRCLAALLAPYLVYTVAMLLIGQMDAYLIWVFLPTVTAGLLIGATLDHAHKRHQDE
jgi:hypothetical protein